MKIGDAVKIAEKSDEVKALVKDGFFLNSGMAFIEAADGEVDVWNLTYYEPTGNVIVQVVVEGDSVMIKERGTPMKPTKLELKMADVKTNNVKMLEKARAELTKYKQPVSQIILSLQRDQPKRTTWRINFITKTLFLVTVTIDAKTGKILSSQMQNLVK